MPFARSSRMGIDPQRISVMPITAHRPSDVGVAEESLGDVRSCIEVKRFIVKPQTTLMWRMQCGDASAVPNLSARHTLAVPGCGQQALEAHEKLTISLQAQGWIEQFDVNEAHAYLDSDREHLLGCVESGFHSLEEFNELVRSQFGCITKRLYKIKASNDCSADGPHGHRKPGVPSLPAWSKMSRRMSLVMLRTPASGTSEPEATEVRAQPHGSGDEPGNLQNSGVSAKPVWSRMSSRLSLSLTGSSASGTSGLGAAEARAQPQGGGSPCQIRVVVQDEPKAIVSSCC